MVLGAGDLDVEEMTGELVASLIGGTASVVRHGAGSVAVTVDAGEFDASFVDVPSRLHGTVSTSGGIDVLLPAGPYALDLDANGLLTVDEAILDDPNSPNEVVLTAASGSIRVSAADPVPPPLAP